MYESGNAWVASNIAQKELPGDTRKGTPESLYTYIRALAEQEVPIGTSADINAAFSSRALQFAQAALSDHSERCNLAVRSIINAFPAELVTHICLMLPMSDRMGMCSVSRGWRLLLIAEPTIWSEGDIYTPAELRWVIKNHQNTLLSLRSRVTMRYHALPRQHPIHTASYDRYSGSLPSYDFRPQLAPYLRSWRYIAPSADVQQEIFGFRSGWPVLEELDTQAMPSDTRPALQHDLAQSFPALRILHLPPCFIPSDISPMRSVARLSVSLHVATPLSVFQVLQKFPSLQHLELQAITSAAIVMFAAHFLPHTLRSVLFHKMPAPVGLLSRTQSQRIDYSPLIQSMGRSRLSLNYLSLAAVTSIGDAAKVFTSLVVTMPSSDAAMSILAHGEEFSPAPVKDYVASSGSVQYQLPGIQDRTDMTAISIKVSLTAKLDGLIAQLQSQGHLPESTAMDRTQTGCLCTENILCTNCTQRLGEAMLNDKMGTRRSWPDPLQRQTVTVSTAAQRPTGRGIRMSQALLDLNLASQLWNEVEHLEPSFTARISHLELSGYSLKGLIKSHLSIPTVRSLRLIITCEGDGWILFDAPDTPDSSSGLTSAATSLPNLRTLHAECALYIFGSASTIANALSKLEEMIPRERQGNRAVTMHYLDIYISRLKGRRYSPAPQQHGVAALTLAQLHAQSQHRARTLERWFIHLLPGLASGYNHPLDAITVRLPLWDGFETVKMKFETMAEVADKLTVLGEPDSVLHEDPQTLFKIQGLPTYWSAVS
ncbi:hypothetical protein BKA62DRAFT_675180 [Auriculariales sp. MPI-PUGE-AT-0066]|nr:hypothetical protein BKA62DRAFT_675180 [Auriculariales sp. MPI-PUGE-AT-0066]